MSNKPIISSQELDKIFDEGKEDIIEYLDFSKARRPGLKENFMPNVLQQVTDIFTEAFIKIMVNSKDIDINPSQLKQESRKHTVDNWLDIQRAFTGGSGLLTGILGGPWAYAGEVGDIAILLRSISRGCFGTGYILQNSVNYEEDMICIMALWTGYASIISIPSDIRAKNQLQMLQKLQLH